MSTSNQKKLKEKQPLEHEDDDGSVSDAIDHESFAERLEKLSMEHEDGDFVSDDEKTDDEGSNTPKDTENSFTTPNGTEYWIPQVPESIKPAIGMTFRDWFGTMSFYSEYAEKSGFGPRLGTVKKISGVITHRYLLCSKAGKPKNKAFDTMDLAALEKLRARTFKSTDCKAEMKLKAIKGSEEYVVYGFIERHNHEMVTPHFADLKRNRRQLAVSDQQFIHNMSLHKIGPCVAHRLQCTLQGGPQNVSGTINDYKNFNRDIRMFIGERDAQMFVEKMQERAANLENFTFEFSVVDGELRSAFWVDGISKLNYNAFGDVGAFDATYHTNKYNMIFVPFTGVDQYRKGVTFASTLLASESVESYEWLLKCFVKTYPKQPSLVLSDQDPLMKQAIQTVFINAKHRLCMWHIMKKLSSKFPGDFLENTTFRKSMHKLVWNVFNTVQRFEDKWAEMINEFNLSKHAWLTEMYNIRDKWVPAYFRSDNMCCLMKTTSRCESSSAAFKVNSRNGNTLVQFLLCFDTSLDNQRYNQRILENTSNTCTIPTKTDFRIEINASKFYTHSVFPQVQKEILKSISLCMITNAQDDGDGKIWTVHQKNKEDQLVGGFKVRVDAENKVVHCSCMGFTRIGYLCRHVFCIFRFRSVNEIPEQYLLNRWSKKALPQNVSNEHQYGGGGDNTEEGKKLKVVFNLVTRCVDRLRGNDVGLDDLITRLTNVKTGIFKKYSQNHNNQTKRTLIGDLVGCSKEAEVTFTAPGGIRNKGQRGGRDSLKRRVVGEREKVEQKSKKKKGRKCSRCKLYVTDHDSRNCPLKEIEETEDNEESGDDGGSEDYST